MAYPLIVRSLSGGRLDESDVGHFLALLLAMASAADPAYLAEPSVFNTDTNPQTVLQDYPSGIITRSNFLHSLYSEVMQMATKYGFGIAVSMDFERAIDVVTEALETEGFGVLTDIDMQATLKKKLGVDMPPYRILGACNPPLAHQALMAEPSVGLLLPCNVVVRQEDSGKVYVECMDPNAVLDLVDNPAVQTLAKQVRERLDRVLAAL